MASEPILFLDVDGVVSPLSVESPWRDAVWVSHADCDLFASPSLGLALETLPVEVVWLTSWGHLANSAVGPALGMTPRAVVSPARDQIKNPRWKGDAVRAVIEAAPRDFIWIDDEANRDADLSWADDLGVAYLVLSTESMTGLTEQHLAQVTAFAQGIVVPQQRSAHTLERSASPLIP